MSTNKNDRVLELVRTTPTHIYLRWSTPGNKSTVRRPVELPPANDPWDRLEATIRDVYRERVDADGNYHVPTTNSESKSAGKQ